MHSTLPPSSSPSGQSSARARQAHTFGGLSHFLRDAIADEDTRSLSDGLSHLALCAEAVVAALRLSRRRQEIAPHLMDMLTVLRDHRALVAGLGLPWHGLYEYAAYVQSLNSFRVLIGQWLLQAGPHEGELAVDAEEFGQVAWRTMGDGMMLVDMYEQLVRREEGASQPAELGPAQRERARQWWRKLRR